MIREPQWIPPAAILDLHAQQIREHGGLPGVQDHGRLEAALNRARQIFAYGGAGPDICDLAAAYAWGISKNHPFVDGNKRRALVAVFIFLGLNGYSLDAREEDAYETMVSLAAGESRRKGAGGLDQGQLGPRRRPLTRRSCPPGRH